MTEAENPFTTPDMYIASAIALRCGIEPALRATTGMVMFMFQPTEAVLAAVRDFQSNALQVDAASYSQMIKALRGMMFKRREAAMLKVLDYHSPRTAEGGTARGK